MSRKQKLCCIWILIPTKNYHCLFHAFWWFVCHIWGEILFISVLLLHGSLDFNKNIVIYVQAISLFYDDKTLENERYHVVAWCFRYFVDRITWIPWTSRKVTSILLVPCVSIISPLDPPGLNPWFHVKPPWNYVKTLDKMLVYVVITLCNIM